MVLKFKRSLADKYKNHSQIARILTENWVKNNAYCPNCGGKLIQFKNNHPGGDFFCNDCNEEFELKSKKKNKLVKKILNGAYRTLIEKIKLGDIPHFFILTYDKIRFEVKNFLIIPGFYFIPDIIEKKKPLSKNAERAGWIGCYINLSKIPASGRIFIIKQSKIVPKRVVRANWKQVLFLKDENKENKGWLIDIMKCLDMINKEEFFLRDIYSFENFFKQKYPNNHFIKDKIRQQLQVLREKGFLEFLGNGKYRKIKLKEY